MDRKTIFVIALSAVVLLIVFCAAVAVFIKYKKICKSSDAVCPDFTSSTNKRCGKHVPSICNFVSLVKVEILMIQTM